MAEISTSVVYPAGIAPALGHLNSSRNEIELFVEDTSALNVWRTILRKFLPPDIVFNDPIPLGGRDRVLEECRKDQADDGRKKLYIIDADLDLAKGLRKPNLKHLYRLRAYCIENYLLEAGALVKLAQVLDVDVSEDEARKKLDFDNWISLNDASVRKLFVCYAISHYLCPEQPTVSYFIGRLCAAGCREGVVCESKVNARIIRIYREIRSVHSYDVTRETYTRMRNNCDRMCTLRFVSAKDCLLKLIFARLHFFFGNMRSDQMKVLLAGFIPTSVDPHLLRRLSKICNS